MTIFQTLGDLGAWMSDRPDVQIVDAGIPLTHYADTDSYGPVWRNQPSVRKVVSFIARHLASTPWDVYERVSDTDRRKVRDGALAALMSRPSSAPGETRTRFIERLMIDALLHDRFAAMIVANPDGTHELVRIPARMVRFKADALDRIDVVRITGPDGRWKDYDPARFLLDAGYAQRGAGGTSPMVTMSHLLAEQREAVEYRRQIWKRGARIPGVIERPNAWPSDGVARDRFIRGWQAFEQGGGREGGTPVLDDGMTYRELQGFSPKDALDLEGRRLSDVEVCTSYHIAPEILGVREGTFANLQAFKQMLFSVALGPYFATLEDLLNATLVPLLAGDRDLYIEANVDAKLRGSFEEQTEAIQVAVGAPIMTRNEGRALRNLPAITGGDDLITPLNVLAGGQASPRDSAPKHAHATGPRVKMPPADAYRDTLKVTFRDFFAAQRVEILAALGTKTATTDWWDDEHWNTALAERLYDLAVQIASMIGRQTAEQLGFEADDYDVPRTVAFLRAMVESRAAWVNATTRDQIVAVLADVEDERTPVDVFDDAEENRSHTAGWAMAAALAGWASIESARQLAPTTATKTWLTSSKSPRATHSAMDGVTVPVAERFPNGMDWPGDPVGGPGEVANCMCGVEITTGGM